MLLLLIMLPVAAAIVVAASEPARARSIALVGTAASVVLYAFIASSFQWFIGGSDSLEWSAPWLPALGLKASLGADPLSMLLIGLTVLLGPICVVASTTAITRDHKTYYAWLLVLQGAMTGVFAARDVAMFYIFFEFTLVPMYILISLFGSTNRKAAAIKFFLYTFTGSIIALAGIVYVAQHHAATVGGGVWSLDLATLTRSAQTLPAREQALVFFALMAGFAVKVPIFPLHTWLPLAHTEAPTAGSVILAGVLLKLGTYAIYKIAIPFCPVAAWEYAPLVGGLGVAGVLIGGLICWVQTDVKKLVAYSSVAHLGFCVLGLFAFNAAGFTGAILYMINHGLSTGALFLLIGMVYERHHTRSMKELGGLARTMPVWSTFMVFFAMASVGLPGLNGFVSEFLCLLGTFQAGRAGGALSSLPGWTPGTLGPWYAALAGVGMIVAAMYILLMVGNVVWGSLKTPHGHGHEGAHDAPSPLPTDLSGREIGVMMPLAVLCLVLGVYPKVLTDVLEIPVQEQVRMLQGAREGRLQRLLLNSSVREDEGRGSSGEAGSDSDEAPSGGAGEDEPAVGSDGAPASGGEAGGAGGTEHEEPKR